jgi:membrane-bound lytic murein transglycosylase B
MLLMNHRSPACRIAIALVLSIGLGFVVAVAAEDEGDARFAEWISTLRTDAAARGISDETLDASLSDIETLDDVIEKDRNQPEFTMTFETYRRRVVTQSRIATGRKMMAENRELLAEVHKRYGVQPRFVVALWGIESNYGKNTGNYSIVQALVTLAYDGRRSKFFRGELLDALEILEDGHIEAASMLGSWAGAMGQPQFMPSSFRSFAVDQDGDSKRNIWTSTPDVLGSAANYLSSNGWKDDYIWGREVRLPEGFDRARVGRKVLQPLSELQSAGVRRVDGSDLPTTDIEASIIEPDGPGGAAFVVYKNYHVLLSWNRSDFFATAVGLISDSLAGH